MATITETQKINPNDLLVDLNVREDLRLDKALIASIKDLGVLQPIVATRTDEGLRVRYGHRRTRAAVEAGLDTVPVIVVSAENDGDADAIERLLSQYAENEHRTGLTTGEKIGVSHQLSLLGVPPAQIAKRTHTKRADVDAHLSVATSDLAAKATDRYDLTLDQAAAVAEFEDDTETVKALIAAAKTGQFEHVAQRARQDRDEAAEKAPIIEALNADGLTVVDQPDYDSPALGLHRLLDTEGKTITEEQHLTCEGHAVYLVPARVHTEPDGTVLDVDRWGQVTWPEGNQPVDEEDEERRWSAVTVTRTWVPKAICLDPKTHGHRDAWDYSPARPSAADLTPEQREAAKAARRLVIENNRAWTAAREVRRGWVKTLLTRKTLPTGAGNFIAHALTSDSRLLHDHDANTVAAEWFGAEPDSYGTSRALRDVADQANDKRALVIALGTVLAAYEHDAGDRAWRQDGEHSSTGRYLRFLADLGYTLSPVEEYAISSETA